MKLVLSLFLYFGISIPAYAESIVNVYVWGGEIPAQIIDQFEKKTGIKVNFSTYDSNETMYAKLRTSKKAIYDVILPSAYYIERMQKQGMLTQLDHTQLTHLTNLNTSFSENTYDPGNHYSIPLIWGITGIFYNQSWVKSPPRTWQSLWDNAWRQQLLLLDDAREIFGIALMSLGYQPNDTNPQHIQQAYQKLLTLKPNIKLFSNEGIQAMLIDGDATLGTAWNGDAFKAHTENPHIQFIYPQEGFVIWVDCLAIPYHAPHIQEAYQFINFLLEAESAAQIALVEGHAITNAAGKKLLPPKIRDNVTLYPPDDIFKRGYFQRDVGEKAVALYNEYWQELKLAL